MQEADFVECPECGYGIDVSDLANDYIGCGWFSDGNTVDVCCSHCDNDVELLINVSLSYKVIK